MLFSLYLVRKKKMIVQLILDPDLFVTKMETMFLFAEMDQCRL